MQTNSHLSRLIHDQAKKYGDREVLIYKDFGGSEWKSYSWNQFSDMVKKVSNAMLNLGVKVQENVGVFSQNSAQYLFCDFGAWGIRAVTIPFYATSSEQQIQFMVKTMLGLKEVPKPDDTADAIAAAICHGRNGDAKKKLFEMK